jgi:hypothetical protein
MKSIDIKSLLIGILLTSTVIFGVAATSKTDGQTWDKEQQWEIKQAAPDVGHLDQTNKRRSIRFSWGTSVSKG